MQKKDIPIIERSAPIDRVLPFLTTKTHVWVTEGKRSEKVVGVITEHDILSILASKTGTHMFGLPDMRSLDKGSAEDIMTKRVVKCNPSETIEDALDRMRVEGIRRLPVVDDNDVILGEVRLWHILKKFIAVAKKK